MVNAEYRQLVVDAVREAIGARRQVAVAFSAGTDSLCLLFACLDLGMRPVLYTYHVAGTESADLTLARRTAEHWDLPLVECPVPADDAVLQHDVLAILRDGVRGKVHIQCVHGHRYVAARVREPVVLNGSGADALYGTYRSIFLNGARDDKAVFDRLRLKHLCDPNDDAMADQARVYRAGGTQVRYPYRWTEVVKYLMGLTWPQINKPRFKAVAVRAFPEYFDELGCYRRRGSQQVVAGVNRMHDRLLRTPWNRKGRRRVQELYRDVAEAHGLAWKL